MMILYEPIYGERMPPPPPDYYRELVDGTQRHAHNERGADAYHDVLLLRASYGLLYVLLRICEET